MPGPSESARLKLARAKAHIAELTAKWEAFKAAGHLSVVAEKNAGGTLDYRLRMQAPIPVEWSCVLGDGLHNLRTVLDHLVCSAVERNGQTPNYRTRFPFSTNRATFRCNLRDALRGASARAHRLVRRLRPYGGGNDTLCRLHQLDVADKHNLVLTVGTVYQSANLRFTAFFPDGKSLPLALPLRPADRMFPLKDGDVLFGNVPVPTAPAPGQMGLVLDIPGFTLDLAFSRSQVVDGEPVFKTLSAYVAHVEHILKMFERFVF